MPVMKVDPGGVIKGVALIKDANQGNGAFSNTTSCNGENGGKQFPIKQELCSDGKTKIGDLGIKDSSDATIQDITWKSSENAYHGQKLLELKQQLIDGKLDSKFGSPPAIDKAATMKELDVMILELAKSPTAHDAFMPNGASLGSDSYEGLLKKYVDPQTNLGKLFPPKSPTPGSPSTPKHDEFSEFNKACGVYANKEKFMEFVVDMKLQQHPELQKQAMEFAEKGIMPIEISQHDESWASGKDGAGENKLGIIILNLGNKYLQAAGGTPAISNPQAAYDAEIKNKGYGYYSKSKSDENKKLWEYVTDPAKFPAKAAAPEPDSKTPKTKKSPLDDVEKEFEELNLKEHIKNLGKYFNEEYFNNDDKPEGLKDTKYVPAKIDDKDLDKANKDTTLGEIQSKDGTVLAIFKPNSIECPKSEDNRVTDAQQAIFVQFIKMQSETQKVAEGEKATVNISDFHPDDLSKLIKSLQDQKIHVNINLNPPPKEAYSKEITKQLEDYNKLPKDSKDSKAAPKVEGKDDKLEKAPLEPTKTDKHTKLKH